MLVFFFFFSLLFFILSSPFSLFPLSQRHSRCFPLQFALTGNCWFKRYIYFYVAVVLFTVWMAPYVTFPHFCPPSPLFLPFFCHHVPLNLLASHLSPCVLSSTLSPIFIILSCSVVSSPSSSLFIRSLIFFFTSPPLHLHLSLYIFSLSPTFHFPSFLPPFSFLPSSRSATKSWRSTARAPRA